MTVLGVIDNNSYNDLLIGAPGAVRDFAWWCILSLAAIGAQLLYAAPSHTMCTWWCILSLAALGAQLLYAAPSHTVCTTSGYRQR
jgi:hypothetical protein